MTEHLDFCHLCGTPMGSHSPICPKCFARSDPAARNAIRAMQEAQHAAETRERLAQEQDAASFWPLYAVLLAAAVFGLIVVLTR